MIGQCNHTPDSYRLQRIMHRAAHFGSQSRRINIGSDSELRRYGALLERIEINRAPNGFANLHVLRIGGHSHNLVSLIVAVKRDMLSVRR